MLERRTVGIVLTLAIVAACHNRPMPAPLQEDPRASQTASRGRPDNDQITSATMWPTPELIANLEAAVTANPEDLISRRKLLTLYGRQGRVVRLIGRDAVIAARRTHILWLIAHHPDLPLGTDGRLPARNDSALPDPEGYAAGKTLWLREAAKPGAGAQIVANAAAFLEDADAPIALGLWKRALAMEPANGLWMERLGSLCARVLATTPVQEAAGANRAFVQGIANELERSTNPAFLVAAGSALVATAARMSYGQGADPGIVGLGKAYIDRALIIDPTSTAAHRARVNVDASDRRARLQSLLHGVTKSSGAEYQAIRSSPPTDRIGFSMLLAEQAYAQGNAANYRGDTSATDTAWELARTYAHDALALAAKRPTEAVSGAAIYRSQIVLAMLSLRAGDRRGAVRHMLDASHAPASDELAYGADPFSAILVAYLLEYGERETVIEFLRRASGLKLDRTQTMLADIDAIRANRLPATYQGLVTR